MAKYANAPLKYVVFVAELSPASVLGETAALDTIHDALRDDLPVREDLTNALLAGPDGLTRSSGARFVDGSQHRAVLVTPSRITADTTRYSTFSEFSAFLGRFLDAVAVVAPGRACRRLGLRYIDEIRAPGTEAGRVDQWRDWIDESLLPAVALRETVGRREISGVIEDTYDDGYGVRFTWHTGTGFVVQPPGPASRPKPKRTWSLLRPRHR